MSASLAQALAWEGKCRQIERLEQDLPDESRTELPEALLDFVPAITPRWQRPQHLHRIAELFERIMQGERIRALVSVPPQHGKTELLLHGLAWLLRKKPWLRNSYVSYAAQLARTKSKLARDYALAAGVELRRDATAATQWNTPEGGGLLAGGVGGPLTGSPVDGVMLIDDPHKNRVEAESQTIRDKIKGWFTSTAASRLHPGASCLVVHTRWHDDDLIGWLKETKPGDWEIIELRAICEGDDPDDDRQVGEALWPEFWSVQALEVKRKEVGEYDWASLYEQRPKPRGATVFGEAHFFTDLPEGWTPGVGLDFAYTKKTKSDWNVGIEVAALSKRLYIIGLNRMQARAPVFARRLRAVKTKLPGARFAIYAAGTERGTVDMMNEGPPDEALDEEQEVEGLGLDIEAFPAVADKFIRAQKTAASWNAGRILLPGPDSPFFGPWVGPLIARIKAFTGEEGGVDDDVDALAAIHDALTQGVSIPEDDGLDQYLPTPTF